MIKKGLIDASSLPMWLLIPLISLVCLTLLGSLAYMSIMVYSCVFKNKCILGGLFFGPTMTSGLLGSYSLGCTEAKGCSTPSSECLGGCYDQFWGPPIMINYSTSQCFINKQPVNCSEVL